MSIFFHFEEEFAKQTTWSVGFPIGKCLFKVNNKDTRTRSIPSRHLLVQNEQWNYQNNVWNLFWCFNCWLWRTKYRRSHCGCPKVKKVFLKISQNSQENSWATVSFLIKLQAWVQARSIVLVSVMLSLNMNLDAG